MDEMGRRHHDNDSSKRLGFPAFLLICLVVFSLVYVSLSSLRPRSASQFAGEREAVEGSEAGGDKYGSECCSGVENLELWGPAVKWGTDFRFNRSEQCCAACRDMCSGDGPCLCNSWVFCGHREKCGDRFGEVKIFVGFCCCDHNMRSFLILSFQLFENMSEKLTHYCSSFKPLTKLGGF